MWFGFSYGSIYRLGLLSHDNAKPPRLENTLTKEVIDPPVILHCIDTNVETHFNRTTGGQ